MTSESDSTTPKLAALVIGLVASTALVIHARSYPELSFDDAYISLRYAQRLLGGYGLTWTEGPPVEGYSNLLWVLGCALLAALGVDLVDTPLVLGLFSSIATIAAVVYAFPPRSWSGSLPAFAGAMFVALAGPIAIWSVAGLEGCLVAALLAWALVLLRPLVDGQSEGWKSAFLAGIPLALLCLTRPDGPIFAVVSCAFLLVRSRSRAAAVQALTLGVLPGLAVLGQMAFRLAYYGDWLPNTARAKVAFTATRLETGAQCVASAGLSSWALWVPALLALYVAWRDERRRPRILMTVSLLVLWTAYAASITCGTFGYRMLIPCYVLLVFLFADALDWVQQRSVASKAVAWLATLALLFAFGRGQQRDPNIAGARLSEPMATVKGATIGNALREAFAARDPLVAVDAAGAIPYFSGLRSLDMLGLNDGHIARHRDPSFGHGEQGHELGDGAYVLSHEPDVVVAHVHGSNRLRFPGGREMEADPRFKQGYRRVRIHAEEPVPLNFIIYCRLEGRVGMQVSDGLVTIPGYLFASSRGTQAQFDDTKTLGTRFLQPAERSLGSVELPAGTWYLSTAGNGPLRLSARRQSDGLAASQSPDGIELTLEEAGPVQVTVIGNQSAFLTEVVARRMD